MHKEIDYLKHYNTIFLPFRFGQLTQYFYSIGYRCIFIGLTFKGAKGRMRNKLYIEGMNFIIILALCCVNIYFNSYENYKIIHVDNYVTCR